MKESRVMFAILCVVLSVSALGQGEALKALSSRPVGNAGVPKDDISRVFRYNNITQQIPILDDFSIDRTRKLNAQATDPDVTFQETIYRLVLGGVSTPDMRYSLDTTFLFLVDASDPPITIRTALPSVVLSVRDLSVDPPTNSTQEAWPSYDIRDTVETTTPDTIFQVAPDLVQDSVLVYEVAPSTETYEMGGANVPLILWEDDDVFINGTYPIEPPTVGVATFDGLSRTGYPYDFENYTAYGKADRLTSVPIDLEYPASDAIFLSFFYQAKGLSGDSIGQPQDSLILEFFAPLEQSWYQVWGIPYVDPAAFQQVLIPIDQERFLKDQFQFRFTNYATLSGSFDHWHLDYVRLGAQRTANDVRIVDTGYLYPESSILQTYTSVPFSHFEAAPGSAMALSVDERIRNLDIEDRFIRYGMRVSAEDGSSDVTFENGINTIGNAASIFTTSNTVNSAPNSFVFDNSGEEDAVFWDVKFWSETQPDLIPYNDTIRFKQELSNYYSYDDGSAEAGYGLTTGGAKLAYRYDLIMADSLRAIRMYFNPLANVPPLLPPTDGSFLITIWSSLTPEVIQHQNFSFSSPEYRMDGINKFVEYPLDSAIRVEGSVYIGWTQTNAVAMNIGFDRNRNNRTRIFYNTAGTWSNTSFNGSLMMRPVFVSAVDPFASVEELELEEQELFLYPNPADQEVQFRFRSDIPNGSIMQCLDATGRVVQEVQAIMGRFPVGNLSAGAYVIRMVDKGGATLARGRLIVQH